MTELSSYAFSALREGEFTLYRGLGDGLDPILLVAPVVEHPPLDALKRLEHEYALRTELDRGWATRPLTLTRRHNRATLVLEDPGGEPLDRLLGGPVDVTQFLSIAIPLAAALGRMHARGLIHKDIKPANVLVDLASGGVWLTGFGIASRVPREHQEPGPPDVIAGTLAYMAPEQTGRMNRSIDSRSDLYALGVTFYEMLTGELPFTLARGELQRGQVVLHADLFAGNRAFGDRVQLQQVMLDLIRNGIDAMSAVTDRPRVLAISTEFAEPGAVLVAVPDAGAGLDPATAERIFDPFFTTKANGMGMGLSICRSIIEAHGGRLWASPHRPYGTIFRFTVPIADRSHDLLPSHRETNS